jgi:hypothetical protein
LGADRNALWELPSDLMLRCTFEGVITAVNPAWTAMLNWREEELPGSNLFTLIHPEDLAPTIRGHRRHPGALSTVGLKTATDTGMAATAGFPGQHGQRKGSSRLLDGTSRSKRNRLKPWK